MRNQSRKKRACSRVSAGCLLAALLSAPLGCGVDDPFSAQTDDEYKEPLTDALIGTPTTVTTISSNGESKIVDVALPSTGPTAGAGGGTASGGSPNGAGGKASG